MSPHYKNCLEPEEHDKEFKASSWSKNAPGSNVVELHGMCDPSMPSGRATGTGVFTLSECVGGFHGLKYFHMYTRTQGLLLERCAVAMINLIHVICQWV